MEDKELAELQKERKMLEMKITALLHKVKNTQPDKHQILNLCNHFISQEVHRKVYEQYTVKVSDNDVVTKKLLKLLENFTGMKFTNVTRKWINGHCYKYQTLVKSKAVVILLDLVIQEDQNDFQIDHLTCHLNNADKCTVTEIQTWMQKLTKTKNLSLLLSAVSEYSEKTVIRSKILNKLQENHCGYIEESRNAGISVFIHPPSKPNECYLIIRWTLTFCEWALYITDSTTVKVTESGKDFADKNKSLLKRLSGNFDEGELILLWERLYLTIYDYEAEKGK